MKLSRKFGIGCMVFGAAVIGAAWCIERHYGPGKAAALTVLIGAVFYVLGYALIEIG